MSKVEKYCAWCGKRYTAQRKSSKYCGESCKQKRKNAPDDIENALVLSVVQACVAISDAKRSFTDSHSPDIILSTVIHIEAVQRELNKMLAYIGTIENHQANTWYQCLQCGQRTFGKVDKCDFCESSDWKVLV